MYCVPLNLTNTGRLPARAQRPHNSYISLKQQVWMVAKLSALPAVVLSALHHLATPSAAVRCHLPLFLVLPLLRMQQMQLVCLRRGCPSAVQEWHSISRPLLGVQRQMQLPARHDATLVQTLLQQL